MAESYGTELVLDLHGCDKALFNREDLTRFFRLWGYLRWVRQEVAHVLEAHCFHKCRA